MRMPGFSDHIRDVKHAYRKETAVSTVETVEGAAAPSRHNVSSTSEVRGRIVHWQANKWLVLVAHRLSISSQIFQELLILHMHLCFYGPIH